jgi:hypothetical protein
MPGTKPANWSPFDTVDETCPCATGKFVKIPIKQRIRGSI